MSGKEATLPSPLGRWSADAWAIRGHIWGAKRDFAQAIADYDQLKYIISCVAPFSCSVKSSRLGSPATAPVFLTSAVASTSASGASDLPGCSCGWQPSAVEENQRISKPTKNAFSGPISMVSPP